MPTVNLWLLFRERCYINQIHLQTAMFFWQIRQTQLFRVSIKKCQFPLVLEAAALVFIIKQSYKQFLESMGGLQKLEFMT